MKPFIYAMLSFLLITTLEAAEGPERGSESSRAEQSTETQSKLEQQKQLEDIREQAQRAQEQLDSDARTKVSVEKTIDRVGQIPLADRSPDDINAFRAAQRTLDGVNARMEKNQKLLNTLTQQIEALAPQATPNFNESAYQTALENKLSQATNGSQKLAIIQSEMNRILGGNKSAFIPSMQYDNYELQRVALRSLSNQLDVLDLPSQQAKINNLLDQINQRIKQIDTFIAADPAPANSLDKELNLSQKIPDDRLRLLKTKITSLGGLSPEQQLKTVQEIQQMSDHYKINNPALDRLIASKLTSAPLLTAQLATLQDMNDKEFFLLKQLNSVRSNTDYQKQLRSLKEFQKVLAPFAQQDNPLGALSQRVNDLITQISNFKPELPKTSLAATLGFGDKIPADQAKTLEDHVFKLFEGGDKTISPTTLEEIIKTYDEYNLDAQGQQDLKDILEARLAEEQEAAKGILEKSGVTELGKNIGEDIILLKDLAVDQIADIAAATPEYFMKTIENVLIEAIAGRPEARAALLKVGKELLKYSKHMQKSAGYVETAADATNKIQLLSHDLESLVKVVHAASPETGKKLDSLLNLLGIVESVATGPVGKVISQYLPKGGNLAEQVGKKIITLTDAGAQISDALEKETQVSRDIQIKNEIELRNTIHERLELMGNVEQQIEIERAQSILARKKASYFERFKATVKEFIQKLTGSIKESYEDDVKPRLETAQTNYDQARTIYLRALGLNPSIATPENIKQAIAKLQQKNPQELAQRSKQFAQAVNELASALESYALQLSIAQQSIEFTVNAWDALVVDEQTPVIDQIRSVQQLREQKMAYLQALKDSIADLRQQTSFATGTPVATITEAFVNQLAKFVNGEIVKTAVENQEFVEYTVKTIDTYRRALEDKITDQQANAFIAEAQRGEAQSSTPKNTPPSSSSPTTRGLGAL